MQNNDEFGKHLLHNTYVFVCLERRCLTSKQQREIKACVCHSNRTMQGRKNFQSILLWGTVSTAMTSTVQPYVSCSIPTKWAVNLYRYYKQKQVIPQSFNIDQGIILKPTWNMDYCLSHFQFALLGIAKILWAHMHVLSVRKTGYCQVTYVHEYMAYAQNKSGGKPHLAPNLLTSTPVNTEVFTPSNVLIAASRCANFFALASV